MMTLIFSSIGIMITLTFLNQNLWSVSVSQTSLLFLASTLLLLNKKKVWCHTKLSWNLKMDNLNLPLIMLSFWLIPVSMLASMKHLINKPLQNNQTFLLFLLVILISLMMMFSTTNLLVLFMSFETTLIPTLFLMARWGAQQERMEASLYFVFYTLISSIPLFITILIIYKKENHMNIKLFSQNSLLKSYNTLPVFCLIAFLVKVPIFSVHLWLPKAHVEAPVAGSMILAAILLKMGGYGFMRLSLIFKNYFIEWMAPILLPFCCWGGLLTSLMCLTQTDLKALIAYSSVSHMSFMIAGASLMSNWSMTGAIIMMIAHGVASSALFSLANIYYEITNSRTLSMSRGMKSTFVMLPLFWLVFACANMGIPPLPKAIAELLMFSSLITFKSLTMIFILPTMVLTAIFSLSMFQLTSSGHSFKWKISCQCMKEREYLLLFLHLTPLILIIFNLNSMSF